MPGTQDRQISQEAARQVTTSDVGALIKEATDLIAARGTAPLSAVLAFHERKAALFEELAAEEPENADRQAVAKSAREQVEHLRAMAERGCR